MTYLIYVHIYDDIIEYGLITGTGVFLTYGWDNNINDINTYLGAI
jgi:hypothetical protein